MGDAGASDWAALDQRHVWHPYTQMKTAPAPIPIARGRGAYLETPGGRRILDAISSWWVVLHGHDHPRINAALARQAEALPHVMAAGFANEPAARLAAELVAVAPPGLSRVFYSDDGSTAVEAALKMAVQSFRNRGQPERTGVVALEWGYHGDTFGAMAVGDVPEFQEAFRPLLFDVQTADAAFCYRCPVGKERSSCGIECADKLDAILARDGDRIAAVIVEPMIQGAGGMIIHPPELLVRAREACDRHGVLLIADEVFTGFGRTGKTFACEHGPVTPDILCLSKALTNGYLPLAATLCTEAVYEAFLSEERGRALLHGHSFCANPLGCAVALESLAIFHEEGALARIARLEAVYRERLPRLHESPIVGDTRHLGMVAAVEVVRDKATRASGGYLDAIGPRLAERFLERDLLLRPLGNVIYTVPPLCITDDEVHRIFDAIEAELAQVADDYARGDG